jgi:hypothetical protein
VFLSCEWLHDCDCDGKNWRFCKGEQDFDHFAGDEKACIRVLAGSVQEIKWISGGKAANNPAASDCSGSKFYGTLDQAKAKCMGSSKCEWGRRSDYYYYSEHILVCKKISPLFCKKFST